MAATILALIKAIPALRDIFLKVVDLWQEAQTVAEENQVQKVQKEREATVAAMKAPGLSDSERAVLRRRLWELHKL
jgi:hypothetical protein